MEFRTVLRDCLFLNWAVPVDKLPPPPKSLRYQTTSCANGEFAFVSALLFRQERLRLSKVPLVQVSYPQFNLRFCVLDDTDIPSVLFATILVPRWVVPAVRWIAERPAVTGRFSFPSPSREPTAESWEWVVARHADLRLSARRGLPAASSGLDGPGLGSWQSHVEYIRQRPRGYARTSRGLRCFEIPHPAVDVWPLRVQIEEADLLRGTFPLASSVAWTRLHSSWLCPEISMAFELGREPRGRRLPREVPAPG